MPHVVLIAEGEAVIQELIAINFESAGHHVLRASDAEQALTIIRQTLLDLVLLDWMPPGQSVLAIARHLRGSERTRAIPIIMLTAKLAEQDKLVGLEAGPDDYVAKPFSPREPLARIKAVMRRRGASNLRLTRRHDSCPRLLQSCDVARTRGRPRAIGDDV